MSLFFTQFLVNGYVARSGSTIVPWLSLSALLSLSIMAFSSSRLAPAYLAECCGPRSSPPVLESSCKSCFYFSESLTVYFSTISFCMALLLSSLNFFFWALVANGPPTWPLAAAFLRIDCMDAVLLSISSSVVFLLRCMRAVTTPPALEPKMEL